MIVFECPSCHKKLQAVEEHVGKTIACPACNTTAKVPSASDAPPTAITSEPVGTAPVPNTAVATPEDARKSKSKALGRDDEDDDARQRRRRDREDVPKASMGVGMVLLIVGLVGGSICCVLAVLGALLVPAVQKVRESAERTQTMNHLKMVGLAAHNHHDTFKHFPSPQNQPQPPIMPGMKAPDLSWRVTILPFVEQQFVWQQIDKNANWDHANNLQWLSRMPKEYFCLTAGQKVQDAASDTFFQYFTGPNTMFPDPLRKVSIAQVPDGLSNTFLVSQAAAAVPWTKSADMVVAPNAPLPLPNAPFPALLMDGSVRWIMRPRVPDATLRLIIDPRDGQPIPMEALD